MSGQAVRGALILACACGLAGACQTRPADRESAADVPAPAPAEPTTTAAPTTTSATPSPAPTDARGADLPIPVGERAIGVFTPAPWLDGAERVAVFQHRGTAYIAAAGTGWLQIFDARGRSLARADAPGAAHVLEVVGADADQRVLLALGRGVGRDARDASSSAVVHRFDGRALGPAEAIPLPPSTRAQIVGIAARDPRAERLWLGAFESKYIMALYAVERGDRGYQARAVDRMRVPLSLSVGDPDGDGEGDLFIARPYGDSAELPGDVFRWRDGAREPLPSVRGARAVLAHGNAVFLADGWHKDYGRQANALITRVERAGDDWRARVLVHVRGRHGYTRLRVGDVDGDREPDLLAAGNGPAIVIPGMRPVLESVATLGTVEAWDIAVGDLAAGNTAATTETARDRRDQVVIVGETSGIWHFGD